MSLDAPELTDAEALTRAADGDLDAFGVLYERYVTRIYNYIYYRTGNPHEAEDLTARVFQRAARHIPNYRQMGVPFAAWLYRIAHNLVANWHRDRSRRREVPLDDQPRLMMPIEHPESTIVRTQEMQTLLKAIRSLTPERQNLVIFKFVEQLSNAEIAVIMGRTEGAIKSLYHRTLLALREELERLEKSGG
ncbi:MAG TPA: sigma-70 family RNA polymerase sigma factor [Anaerolineaceae bacterium]|jgi:RNA polymerase sigma-70 factor (ECF subfamily)|nr:sigma-70 family RNA polymerase sigma factor [Longilinea sp.]HNZ13781.1 sigma-70 family RNA polymerase sigma factor [Anaerolineaceae bacterium]HOD04776.1 sigma-70 family RNA polymerase sigma factor [Anaerolineaceae bacterium]HOG79576.1 sigma-70 family RNA polymerase sigma factor [Anaerolineaceae bacterium]HQF62709.1 sigma-70 family RNA polymerase sigma factor [Anaerolineaceae bacterium]